MTQVQMAAYLRNQLKHPLPTCIYTAVRQRYIPHHDKKLHHKLFSMLPDKFRNKVYCKCIYSQTFLLVPNKADIHHRSPPKE